MPQEPLKARLAHLARRAAPFLGVSLLAGVGEYAVEARVVARTGALQVAASSVVEAAADRADVASEGKLVHVAGELSVAAPLADEPFGVRAPVVRLLRDVEVLNWVEVDEEGKGVTYVKRWVREPVASLRFQRPAGHDNPRVFPYTARVVSSDTLRLGAKDAPAAAWALDPALATGFEAFEPLPYDDAMLAAAPADVRARGKVVAGALYLGNDPEHPAVGDARITFARVRPGPASVLAAQAAGGPGEPTRLRAWIGPQGPFHLVAAGGASASELLGQQPIDDAPLRSWGARVGILALLALAAVLAARRVSESGRIAPRGVGIAFLALVAVPLLAAGRCWSDARGWLGAALYGAALIAGLAASGLALPERRREAKID